MIPEEEVRGNWREANSRTGRTYRVSIRIAYRKIKRFLKKAGILK